MAKRGRPSKGAREQVGVRLPPTIRAAAAAAAERDKKTLQDWLDAAIRAAIPEDLLKAATPKPPRNQIPLYIVEPQQ